MDIFATLLLVSVFQGFVTAPAPNCPGNSCGKQTTTPSSTTTTTATTATTTTTTTTTTSAISRTYSSSVAITTTVSKDQNKNGQVSETVYVSIPVIVVLVAIITGVVLCLKRQKITSLAKVIYRRNGSSHVDFPGSGMITNTSYENAAISSKASTTFDRTPETLDSGYTEIAIGNLENNSSREYRTIDSLHEDHTVSANAYGHLKDQTGRFDSKTYSHMSQNHAGTTAKSENMNYSHIGKPDHEVTITEVKTDITYNALDTLSNLSTGRYKTDDRNANDEETEYDHARAGMKDTLSEIKKPDEYAHLNSTVRKPYTQERTIERTDMTDNEAAIHEMNSVGYFKDSEKLIKDKMTNTTTGSSNQNVARNSGYEVAVGSTHAYLILEPEKEHQNDKDVHFHIIENKYTENCGASECDDPQSHTYFILEKNNNLT